MSQFIDTHIHLDLLDAPSRQLAEAQGQGVDRFIVPGVRISGWAAIMACAAENPRVLAAPGVHPLDAESWRPGHAEQLGRLLESPEAVALGEVGLDRQIDTHRELQEEVFRQMIRLACDTARPLLLHNRGATGRLLEILREERAGRVGGILHAFNGSLETARELIALGFALGLGGVLTFPEARRLPGIIDQLPDQWLVLETDAPDMPPHPWRDQPNRPAHLLLVAAKLAELRGWDLAETARITTDNARRVLQLA